MRMTTPIRDFVEGYVAADAVRLHMPGHKGASLLGFEAYDITEVAGADSLYEADGIIRQSEQNASRLFGCRTYYSTEGSSQCIRAMLQLVGTYAGVRGIDRPLVLAGRNAHKTFLSAAALLDLDVEWLYPDGEDGYLTCTLTPARLEAYLAAAERLPAAVYVTSPDYLGNVADVAALAAVCHAHGVLLLVDNAHGAYLKFLKPSRHPMDLGADLCCDSAHKTLPVLTGGAYLHVGAHLTALSEERVKHALALFGSTSPSYLILQSLDLCNAVMDDKDFADSLQLTATRVASARARLEAHADRHPRGVSPRASGGSRADAVRGRALKAHHRPARLWLHGKRGSRAPAGTRAGVRVCRPRCTGAHVHPCHHRAGRGGAGRGAVSPPTPRPPSLRSAACRAPRTRPLCQGGHALPRRDPSRLRMRRTGAGHGDGGLSPRRAHGGERRGH